MLITEILACVIFLIIVTGIIRTSVSTEAKNLYEHNNSKKINRDNDNLKNAPSTDKDTEWNLILVNSSHKLDKSYVESIPLTPVSYTHLTLPTICSV